GCLAGRGAPAAPVVADAVFLPVGEIRVPGPELVLDVGVVAAALVDVVDDQRDRGARGHLAAGVVLEHSREDVHGVGLAALGGEARLAGPALVQKCLNFLGCQAVAGRTAVTHATAR